MKSQPLFQSIGQRQGCSGQVRRHGNDSPQLPHPHLLPGGWWGVDAFSVGLLHRAPGASSNQAARWCRPSEIINSTLWAETLCGGRVPGAVTSIQNGSHLERLWQEQSERPGMWAGLPGLYFSVRPVHFRKWRCNKQPRVAVIWKGGACYIDLAMGCFAEGICRPGVAR